MTNTFEDVVSQIKERLDILEVVSEEVVLKKSGSNYWGLCPFHKEKTPSFSVNPTKGIYKCFGCGEGGDALSFLLKIRNVSFYELIKDLADKFRIEMPATVGKKDEVDLRPQMREACKEAAEFYKSQLLTSSGNEDILNYLKLRDISKSVIEEFDLGWAKKDRNLLLNHLKKEFSTDVLEKAGLIIKGSDGSFVDRFRNRIIIPIRNENGDYVAFGARAVEDGQNPKYLNSNDSLIYNKSKLLFGMFTAKDAVKESDSVIIMEGYFDVISAQAHGIRNCVASCGTSLTQEHVKLISKYSKSRRIYLSFDTDTAGLNATKRGASVIKEVFQGLGDIKQFDESYLSSNDDKYACEVRVISPPEGKDPDEFIRTSGAESYMKYVENAPLFIDFELNEFLKRKDSADSPIKKSQLVKEIIPLLSEIKNDIILGEYIKIVASTLKIDETALHREIKKSLDSTVYQEVNVKPIVTKSSSIAEKVQKNLLSVYIVNNSPYNFRQIDEMISSVHFMDENLIIVKNTIDKLTYTVNNVRELIEQLYTAFINDTEKQAIITDLVTISETFNNLSPKDFKAVIDESINRLEAFVRDEEMAKLRQLYTTANNDDIEALKIQMQLRDSNILKTGDN